MYEIDLHVIIQKTVIKNKTVKQNLTLENVFLIQKWNPCDMDYSISSEDILKKFHHFFENPSFSAQIIY